MERRRRTGARAWLRSVTAIASAAMCAGAALAQDEPAPDEETIIVTGSRIPRPDQSSVSPILVIDAEDVAAHGALNFEDFLNKLPFVSPDFSRASNNPGNGAAYVNLRALGPNRTLVLLNGRRVAPHGAASAADLNGIPAPLIERVEVVTGGASAVYGPDAIAGVVNFITRRDFEGWEIGGQSDIYGAGDGAVHNAHAAWGASALDGRAHLLVYVDYLERNPLLADARDFTRHTFSDDVNGALFIIGSFATPEGVIDRPAIIDGVTVARSIFEPGGSLRPFAEPHDFYEFAPDTYLQTPLNRYSAGVLGSFEVSPHVEAFIELMFSAPRVDRRVAPAAMANSVNVPIDAPFFTEQSRTILSQNYDPDGDGIARIRLLRRFTELPRFREHARDYYRAAAGARGVVEDWTWDFAFTHARNDTSTVFTNAASLSRIQQGLLVDPAGACLDPSGGCVAVNLFGAGALSAEAVDFIRVHSTFEDASVEQQTAALSVAGEIFEGPAGPARVSFGGEWRRLQTRHDVSPEVFSGDGLGGFPFQRPVSGDIETRETFGEVLIPLLMSQPLAHSLEIEAGARFTEHSTAGSAWTWKYGGQWRPTEHLRFRAMAQRAVRAPNIGEVFTHTDMSPGSLDPFFDFCTASNDPIGRGIDDVCIAQGMDPSQVGVYDPASPYVFDVVSGGNPDLESETADTITMGFDWEFEGPWSARFSVDWFKLNLEGAIFSGDPFFVFVDCLVSGTPDNPACRLTTRDAGGFITRMDNIPINFARAAVEAVDVAFALEADAPSWTPLALAGQLSLEARATHYLQSASAISDFLPLFDCVGYFFCGVGDLHGLVLPSTTAVTTLNYTVGPTSFLVRWRWVDGTDNVSSKAAADLGLPPPVLAIPSIEGVHYIDLGLRYDLGERVRLRAGVDNVFEADPPLLASAQQQANTEPSRYDVFGRRFFVGVDVRFGQ